MIFLGVDPGTASMGYGVVERTGTRLRTIDYGVLQTAPDLPLPERLAALHHTVCELIETHAPTLLGIERIFFTRNAQTAFAVGQARGVVLLAAAQHGLDVREATPNEIKAAISGYGAADKAQVQRMVRIVLGLRELPAPDDAADALAVAIWAAHRERAGHRLNAGRLDRAAIPSIDRRPSAYERAVREAIARDRSAAGQATGAQMPAGPGKPGHVPTRSRRHSSRIDAAR